MRNGKDNDSCLFGEELVAYIYDELASDDSSAFEAHLLNCTGCAAEFADISMSRLGVYEWHRDDFLPLETPHFDISFATPRTAGPRLSWLDTLQGLFVSPMRIAFAGGSLAAVILGFVIVVSYQTSDDNVAAVVPVPSGSISTPAPAYETNEPVVEVSVAEEPKRNEVREFKNVRTERRPRAVQAKANVPRKRPNTESTNAANAPRLGSFVEAEDTSLRLADLMADIDTKD